jgi:hypothetical protein
MKAKKYIAEIVDLAGKVHKVQSGLATAEAAIRVADAARADKPGWGFNVRREDVAPLQRGTVCDPWTLGLYLRKDQSAKLDEECAAKLPNDIEAIAQLPFGDSGEYVPAVAAKKVSPCVEPLRDAFGSRKDEPDVDELSDEDVITK